MSEPTYPVFPASPGLFNHLDVSAGDITNIGSILGLSDSVTSSENNFSTAAVSLAHQFPDGNVTPVHIVNAAPMIVELGIDNPNVSTHMLPLTNFNMCAEINYLVGNIAKPSHETMRHQKKIIEGEWNEMCEHVESGDIEALRDDIADMLFTVYGMAARLGIPADLDFMAVCYSQYSKFDNNVVDALKTRDKYLEKGITTYYDEQLHNGCKVYVTYSAIDQTGLDNKPYPAGKWLKSCNFKEPVFEPLSE